MTARNEELEKFESDVLQKEMESRGYYVSMFDPADEDPACPECREREESAPGELEQIHYLLANRKTDEAVEKMREFIYDQIGRSS